MIYNIIYKLHSFFLCHMLEWCSSFQTLHLTMWLCLVIVLYVVIVAIFKTLNSYNFKADEVLVRICKTIESNDFLSCVRLLEEYPQYINKFTDDGYTPFLIACANGNTQIVKLMIRKGANVSLKSTKNESPFYLGTFYYIKYPHLKNAMCIRELYYAGADINESNAKGLNPLQMAAMFGHTALVKWLLHKNASTSTVPDPYVIACSQGHQDTARLIWTHAMGFSLKYK